MHVRFVRVCVRCGQSSACVGGGNNNKASSTCVLFVVSRRDWLTVVCLAVDVGSSSSGTSALSIVASLPHVVVCACVCRVRVQVRDGRRRRQQHGEREARAETPESSCVIFALHHMLFYGGACRLRLRCVGVSGKLFLTLSCRRRRGCSSATVGGGASNKAGGRSVCSAQSDEAWLRLYFRFPASVRAGLGLIACVRRDIGGAHPLTRIVLCTCRPCVHVRVCLRELSSATVGGGNSNTATGL